jgi:hypothetical protein
MGLSRGSESRNVYAGDYRSDERSAAAVREERDGAGDETRVREPSHEMFCRAHSTDKDTRTR